MKGFYIYCVCLNKTETKKIRAKGVEFGDLIYPIPFEDIEAIVSEIDISKFNEKNIKEKIQSDLRWTKKNVSQHHKIVDKVFKEGEVIPMKFGILFKTKKGLEAMLKKYYKRFRDLLEQLKDKQEWGVKVYLDSKEFIKQLKKKDKELRQFEKGRDNVLEGMNWYLDRKMDAIINQKLDNEIEKELGRIINQLKKRAIISISEILPKELYDKAQDMVLNSACLAGKEKAESFKKDLEKTLKEFNKIGFDFNISGPWPPYSFVEIKK